MINPEFHEYLAGNEYIQERVQEFLAWLVIECGGGCSLDHAVERWGGEEIEAALAQQLVQRAGPDLSDVAIAHKNTPDRAIEDL